MKWMGFTLITIAALAVAANLAPAMAASAAVHKVQSAPSMVSIAHQTSRRRYRAVDQPSYYGRPQLYAPAPFAPIPPLFGYGWEWW